MRAEAYRPDAMGIRSMIAALAPEPAIELSKQVRRELKCKPGVLPPTNPAAS